MRMKLIGFRGIVAALLLPAIVVRAGALALAPQVGDTYEITLTKDTVQHGSNKSSGSSHDQDTIIERVIGLRAEGLELQYDLPNSATPTTEPGVGNFRPGFSSLLADQGSCSMALNSETRVEGWLKAAGLPRTACGQWYFTWNAFRVECDPQSCSKRSKRSI